MYMPTFVQELQSTGNMRRDHPDIMQSPCYNRVPLHQYWIVGFPRRNDRDWFDTVKIVNIVLQGKVGEFHVDKVDTPCTLEPSMVQNANDISVPSFFDNSGDYSSFAFDIETIPAR